MARGATLRDVQQAMAGEPKHQEEIFTSPSYSTPVSDINSVGQVAEKRYVIFKLVKRKRGRTRIDGICDAVQNPQTKRRERVWLLNGALSIWQSEILDLLKDKDYVNRNRRSLTFEDGVCRIPVEDELAIEFARVNKHNVGDRRSGNGKFDFYEYDANAEQKARLERQMKKINVVLKVKDMPVDKMKKLASFLGIMPFDELGQLKEADGIRHELLIKADSQPELVDKYFDSKEVEISYLVKKAIIEAKIDLTGQAGNALWAGGKGFICKVPSTRKPHEYLTELAMTNSEDGRRFYEQLQQMVQ